MLIFHYLILKFSAFDHFSEQNERITEVLNIKLKSNNLQAVFFLLTLVIAYDLKVRKRAKVRNRYNQAFWECDNLVAIPSRDKILHDLFW